METKTYKLALTITLLFITNAEASNPQTVRVLSLKSEGGKAFIPALLLNNLERALGGNLSAKFDLIIADGGSGLVAAAIGSGYTTFDAINMLATDENGHSNISQIYKQTRSRKAKATFGGNKYSSKSLDKFLDDNFKNKSMAEMSTPVSILAYDDQAKDVVAFSSLDKAPSVDLPQALKATMATKGMFKPVKIEDKISQKTQVFRDNKVESKDMLAFAYQEAKKHFPNSQNMVFVNIEEQNRGTPDAGEKMIKADPNLELFNLQIRLKRSVSADDVSKESMNTMRYSVEDYIDKHRNQLGMLIKRLQEDANTTLLNRETPKARRLISRYARLTDRDEAQAIQ